MARSQCLVGMSSTLEMSAACSGWRRAAKRNKQRMAARRALRVRTLLCRSVSRWARKSLLGSLQTLGGQQQQIGDGRQVPERALRVSVTHVGRQKRHVGFDVDAGAI